MLTDQEYKEMYEVQRGKCKICGEEEQELLVDHNHATGKVRGLLCRKCNTGLGFFSDSTLILHFASEYVRRDGEVDDGSSTTD